MGLLLIGSQHGKGINVIMIIHVESLIVEPTIGISQLNLHRRSNIESAKGNRIVKINMHSINRIVLRRCMMNVWRKSLSLRLGVSLTLKQGIIRDYILKV